jgi:hypothetical protein
VKYGPVNWDDITFNIAAIKTCYNCEIRKRKIDGAGNYKRVNERTFESMNVEEKNEAGNGRIGS